MKMAANSRCVDWQTTKWGALAVLEYGKSLRDYEPERSSEKPFRVFGTNGPIGWHSAPLYTEPSIVVGRKGAYRGIHFSEHPFFVIDTAFYLKPISLFDIRWAYYQLKNFDINKLDSGSAIPSTSRDAFYEIPVAVPPLPTQRRISGILSAYDALIENSQRRIKILEEMARSLYREWFVNFRYPGHESVPLVPSPLGEIPQGWEVKKVQDSFVVSGGGTPSRKEPEFWDGGKIQWYSPSDLTGAGTMFMDDSGDHITELGLTQSSARMFPPRSVMLTSRATIGAIAINTEPACTNQGFITCLTSERVPLYFLFYWLTENVPTFQRMASGATFKEISRGVFKTIDFLHPPGNIVEHFESIATPMAETLLSLQRQIQNLRRTRDLLLPRLLSGQIDVESIELQT